MKGGKMPKQKDPRPSGESGEARKDEKDEVKVSQPQAVVKAEKMPEDHAILTAIKKLYMEEWKREHSRDKVARSHFYVTDADKCPRRIYYDFHHAEQKRDLTIGTILMFRFGDLFHGELEMVLGRLRYTVNRNVEYGLVEREGLPFEKSGRVDVLIDERESEFELLVVLDIKSKNSYAFDSEPAMDEIKQVVSYVHMAKHDKYLKSKGKPIANHAYLLYVDRGGLSREPLALWRVEYSEALVKEIEAEFISMWSAIQKKQLPERPFMRDSVPCSYCRYAPFCWADIPVPEVPKFEADPSIPEPAQEIVESMANTYLTAKTQISELEKQVEIAEKVLKNYFKSKGVDNLSVPAGEIGFEIVQSTVLDAAFLFKTLPAALWPEFSKPSITALRDLVKRKLVDGTTFEKSLVYVTSERLKRKKAKAVTS